MAATGIVVPAHGSVRVTSAVCRASAGAVEHLPVAVVPNLARYLADVKGRDLWAYAADSEGGTAMWEADLRGGFQPLDGQFHWYGRVRSDSLTEATRPGGPLRAGTQVRVRTSYGESAARLSDPDPWGRFRVSGTGRPPFPLEPGVHD